MPTMPSRQNGFSPFSPRCSGKIPSAAVMAKTNRQASWPGPEERKPKMQPFTFNTTPAIVFEPGSARRLGAIAGARLGASVLFVTDAGLRRLGLCDPALASLGDEGRSVTIFDGVEPDPSRATLMRAVEAGRAAGVTGVVALGGGSSLDVAKLA